jgi:hypothetical protein
MTIQIKGVAYETVHARLDAAHDTGARPKGIKRIETSPMEVAGRIIICATVTFEDDRSFSGMSEAKLDATSGADRDAPIECGETSAIGRALAAAGYYGSGGLASQDEIRSAQARGSRFNDRRPTPAAPVPSGGSGAGPRPVAQPNGAPRLAQGLEAPPADDPFAGYDEAGPPAPAPARPVTASGMTAPGLASDRQRATLGKFGFVEEAADPNLTKGHASELISKAIEDAERRKAQGGGR